MAAAAEEALDIEDQPANASAGGISEGFAAHLRHCTAERTNAGPDDAAEYGVKALNSKKPKRLPRRPAPAEVGRP
jgi:hypothetical protein